MIQRRWNSNALAPIAQVSNCILAATVVTALVLASTGAGRGVIVGEIIAGIAAIAAWDTVHCRPKRRLWEQLELSRGQCCAKCLYLMVDMEEGTCPECGQAFDIGRNRVRLGELRKELRRGPRPTEN